MRRSSSWPKFPSIGAIGACAFGLGCGADGAPSDPEVEIDSALPLTYEPCPVEGRVGGFSVELAERSSRRVDDFDVRLAANASFGVFRAAVRAAASHRRSPPMSEMVTDGMRRLRPCFAALTVAVRPARAPRG